MKSRFTPSPWSSHSSGVMMLFPPAEAAAPATGRAHFWSELQSYAETKARLIAEAFRGRREDAEEENFTSLSFPPYAALDSGVEMPPEAA